MIRLFDTRSIYNRELPVASESYGSWIRLESGRAGCGVIHQRVVRSGILPLNYRCT